MGVRKGRALMRWDSLATCIKILILLMRSEFTKCFHSPWKKDFLLSAAFVLFPTKQNLHLIFGVYKVFSKLIDQKHFSRLYDPVESQWVHVEEQSEYNHACDCLTVMVVTKQSFSTERLLLSTTELLRNGIQSATLSPFFSSFFAKVIRQPFAFAQRIPWISLQLCKCAFKGSESLWGSVFFEVIPGFGGFKSGEVSTDRKIATRIAAKVPANSLPKAIDGRVPYFYAAVLWLNQRRRPVVQRGHCRRSGTGGLRRDRKKRASRRCDRGVMEFFTGQRRTIDPSAGPSPSSTHPPQHPALISSPSGRVGGVGGGFPGGAGAVNHTTTGSIRLSFKHWAPTRGRRRCSQRNQSKWQMVIWRDATAAYTKQLAGTQAHLSLWQFSLYQQFSLAYRAPFVILSVSLCVTFRIGRGPRN